MRTGNAPASLTPVAYRRKLSCSARSPLATSRETARAQWLPDALGGRR
ncbi:hypothetical protein WKK05_30860 [Nostoc sp. UHCC 0302]